MSREVFSVTTPSDLIMCTMSPSKAYKIAIQFDDAVIEQIELDTVPVRRVVYNDLQLFKSRKC